MGTDQKCAEHSWGSQVAGGGGGVVITIPLLSESLDLQCSPSFHSLKF